jgi:hypothetical protein
LSRSEKA